MGHKVNPLGLRLNLTRAWESVWYFDKKDYGRILCEDLQIKRYLCKKLSKASVKSIVIDRLAKKITVNINAVKLGMVIGKQGEDIKIIKDYVANLTGLEVIINTIEVKNPDLVAGLVAKSIAKHMEARLNYKRSMKRAIRTAMSTGALGIKICCSGRLGGVEIARKEWYREGSIPLHTLRANIDYGHATAFTTYGCCGVKVWICCPQIQERHVIKSNDQNLSKDNNLITESDEKKHTDSMSSQDSQDSADVKGSGVKNELFISSLPTSKVNTMDDKNKSKQTVLQSRQSAAVKTKNNEAKVSENITSKINKASSNEENKTHKEKEPHASSQSSSVTKNADKPEKDK